MPAKKTTPHEELIEAVRYYLQKIEARDRVRATLIAAFRERMVENGLELEVTQIEAQYRGSLAYSMDMVELATKNLKLNLPADVEVPPT